MRILHWKQSGFKTQTIRVTADEQPVGELALNTWSNNNAQYSTGSSAFSFRTTGWLEQDIIVSFEKKVVARATTSVMGNTKLELISGERYLLKNDGFTFNKVLQDEMGNKLVTFKQAFSLTKGTMEVSDELDGLAGDVLISTSLYLKALTEQQTAFLIAICIPIFMQVIN